MPPTFIPQSKPGQAAFIDHTAIWTPKGRTTQVDPTHTITTSLLDHGGVLGRISVPLLIYHRPR
jgi:hypothetical protein